MIVQDYKDYKIVIARNYGNTTINAYSVAKPVKQLTSDTVEGIKRLIDKQ